MHEGVAAFLTATGLLTCIGTVAMTAGALCAVIEAEWESHRLSNEDAASGPENSND